MISRPALWTALGLLLSAIPCAAQESRAWEVKYPADANFVFGRANGMVIDPSGNVYIAGTASNGTNTDVLVAKFTAAGPLDTTFGNDGITVYDGGANDEGNAIGVDRDGGVYVAGTRSGGSDDILILKFTRAGALDTTFDGDGIRTWDGGNTDRANAILVTYDETEIYVAGTTNNGANTDAILLKYSPSGAFNVTLNGTGRTIYDGGGNDEGRGIAIDLARKIVVVGRSGNDLLAIRYSAYGILDTSFDNDGVLTYDAGGVETGNGVVVDGGSRVCIAGTLSAGGNDDALILRFTAAGTIDTSFSGDGALTHSVGNNEQGNGITFDSAGNLYVAVTETLPGGGRDASVLKYTPAGIADTSFDGDGIRTYATAENDDAVAVALDGANNVYVAGSTAIAAYAYQFAFVARYSPAGLPSRTYSNAGFTIGKAVATDAAGNLYIAGETWNGTDRDILVLKYTSAGVLDTAFSGDGARTYNSGSDDAANAIAVDAQGNVCVAATRNPSGASDAMVLKLTPAGDLDTAFSGDGVQIYDNGTDAANGIAIDDVGNLYVAGSSQGNLILVKYSPAGALDGSFGSGGVATYDSGAADDAANAVAVDASRNVYVAGVASGNALVIKYASTGTLDATFGAGGRRTYDGGNADAANGLTLDRNGNIYVAGQTGNGLNDDLLLLKYSSAGTPDTSFSGDGVATFDGGTGASERFVGVAVDAIGKVVVAGASNATINSASGNFLILKYNVDGSLVSSFGSNGLVALDSGLSGNDLGRGVTMGGSFYATGTWASRKIWTVKYVAAPNVPSNLAATAVSDTKIVLAWTDNANDEDGFKIERSYNGTEYIELATVGKNVTAYDSIDLTPLFVVYYRVRSYNAHGTSDLSNVAAAKTFPGDDGGGGGGGGCFIEASRSGSGLLLALWLLPAILLPTIILRRRNRRPTTGE